MVHSSLFSFTVIAAGAFNLGDCAFVRPGHLRRPTDRFLEDRLRLNGLKLGPKFCKALGAAVRTTTCIGQGIIIVLHFITRAAPVGSQYSDLLYEPGSVCSPVSFPAAIFLGLTRVSIGRARFAKKARQVVTGTNHAIGRMIPVVKLVRTSHYKVSQNQAAREPEAHS